MVFHSYSEKSNYGCEVVTNPCSTCSCFIVNMMCFRTYYISPLRIWAEVPQNLILTTSCLLSEVVVLLEMTRKRALYTHVVSIEVSITELEDEKVSMVQEQTKLLCELLKVCGLAKACEQHGPPQTRTSCEID